MSFAVGDVLPPNTANKYAEMYFIGEQFTCET